jgi:cell wall-associated NlpC family hydrolase
MIEQSRRPLLSSSTDLDALQRRANHQRVRHRHSPRSVELHWQKVRASLGPSVRSVTQLPTRFVLHAIVALVLPLAVALSQLQPGTIVPASQPAAPQQVSDGDLAAPMVPLSLDVPGVVGDAPLEDNGDIPVPLSLVSRSEALAPVIVQGVVAEDRINLRNGPGTQYDEIGHMAAGAPLQVIGKHGDWFQVRERVGKPVFWVSAELIDIPDGAIYTLFDVQDQDIPAPPPPKIALVNESGLAMRDGPGTNYISLGKLQAGAQLDLLERYQDWFHIGVPGGNDGWVKSDFLTIGAGVVDRVLVAEAVPDANPALVGSINDNGVNLRKGPDSRYPKVGGVGTGTQVTLIGKYKDWFQVRLSNGSKAWVFNDLLNVTERVMRRVPFSKDFPALVTNTARARSGSSARPGSSANLANIPASGDVASFAVRFAGSRYVYGGASPSRGFDCSGLTSYVYARFGVNLPHSAAAQFSTSYGASVGNMANLQPGDLVFFVNTAGHRGISHVALYIGGGRVIHAMTPRYGVQVSNIFESYWVQHYYGAIRVRR